MTADLIAELRRAIWDDVPVRLHDRLPSSELVEVAASAYDPDTRKWKPDWTRMEALLDVGYGKSYSPAFAARIGHPDGWGSRELALQSILEVGDMCRSRHQSDLHRCPGRSTSLCERIVSALCEFGQPIGHVAWREGIEVELAEELAEKALRHGFVWRHRQLHRYMRSARERERDTAVYCPLCVGRTVLMRPGRAA